MDTETQVQILDKAVCLSHSVNILEKDIIPSIHPPAVGKTVEETGLFKLVSQLILKEK